MLLEIICIACKSCGEDKQATSDSHVSTSEELTFEERIFFMTIDVYFHLKTQLSMSEFSVNSLMFLQFHPYMKKKKEKDITQL